MTQGRHGPNGWLVVLATTSLLAWSMLAFGGSTLMPPALCSANALPVMPLSASFDLALAFNAPPKLASGWALMLAAMMLPLVVAPLRHVRDRSFARRRARAMLLFVLGYFAVWMAAGMVLQTAALVALWTVPLPLVWLGVAFALAMVWQVSPAKQWCLNRCHRRPQLAAFEPAADRDAFHFGLTNGAACAGGCWALMLLMLLAGRGQFPAMIALTLFLFAERLEGPGPLAWQWRGAGKAIRIAAARLRIIAAVCSDFAVTIPWFCARDLHEPPHQETIVKGRSPWKPASSPEISRGRTRPGRSYAGPSPARKASARF